MATKSEAIKVLFHACVLFLVWVIWTDQCLSQQNFAVRIEKDGEAIHVLKPKFNSAVEAHTSGDDVRILVCGWELGTKESDEHVSSLLTRFAMRYIDQELKKNKFTPQQIEKLELAARIQIARDCREIQLLNTAYRNQKNAKINLLKTCNDIDALIDIGIDRKDSLYRKVKKNLK